MEACLAAISFLTCACSGGDVTAKDSGKIEDIEVRLVRDSRFLDLEERMKALENCCEIFEEKVACGVFLESAGNEGVQRKTEATPTVFLSFC